MLGKEARRPAILPSLAAMAHDQNGAQPPWMVDQGRVIHNYVGLKVEAPKPKTNMPDESGWNKSERMRPAACRGPRDNNE